MNECKLRNIYLYYIYISNSEFRIIVSKLNRKQSRFKESIEGTGQLRVEPVSTYANTFCVSYLPIGAFRPEYTHSNRNFRNRFRKSERRI